MDGFPTLRRNPQYHPGLNNPRLNLVGNDKYSDTDTVLGARDTVVSVQGTVGDCRGRDPERWLLE